MSSATEKLRGDEERYWSGMMLILIVPHTCRPEQTGDGREAA